MKDPISCGIVPSPVLDSSASVFMASNTTNTVTTTASANTSETSRLFGKARSNSSRRRASIDHQTGKPHHYDHRRHHHHDPTKGRSPSPPEGARRLAVADQQVLKYSADNAQIHVHRPARQSWPSFLIQHQLVLSCSVILAIFAAHALVLLEEARKGHSIDWIGSLSAIVPPPIWQNLPQSWTRASSGGPAIVKKWDGSKAGVYSPNESWSSLAMGLQYQEIVVDEVTGAKQVLYSKGWNDLYMVMVWVMIWTAIREAAMSYVFIPLGRSFGVGELKTKKIGKGSEATVSSTAKAGSATRKPGEPASPSATGINTKTVQGSGDANRTESIQQKKEQHAREGKLLRFAEQGWLVLYDGCMWTFGIYLLYHSAYWSDTTYYWRDYPKTHLDATMKWYYLIQFAFWIQQLLLAILGIEKRRKDFLEFMIHHIITCLLIGFSYSCNLTSVGHAVLCAMDFSDIILAACKMLKYMHKDQLADVGFVFFVFTWILSRHYYYGVIIWSTFAEAPKYAAMGWDPTKGMYFTPKILQGFQFLLCSLYMVLLFWLAMIIRVVIKVLKGGNSEDVRSEDEDEEEVKVGEVEKLRSEPALLENVSLAANGTPALA
ncbi:TLC domain-containing protein [Gamsiella multidivaricata]|uniref:TLC domain-containing protein n=1 Tax=Gamsiella multidivaricata TaxID=101098 RepID=UPI00221E5732|nr:TLC domain-containing protein [Gamsiella multidivaricata]KAG0361391.1 sphingosine N-acyltransferase lag1 [Gamsiella multidivaricata]KAI7825656.1 TLC domain-containing protein [Gamsiella multidivaricata]